MIKQCLQRDLGKNLCATYLNRIKAQDNPEFCYITMILHHNNQEIVDTYTIEYPKGFFQYDPMSNKNNLARFLRNKIRSFIEQNYNNILRMVYNNGQKAKKSR